MSRGVTQSRNQEGTLLLPASMDKPVEEAIHHISGLSGTKENLEKLNNTLNGMEDALKNCANSERDGMPLLLFVVNSMDIKEHSLGMIHLLAAQCASVDAHKAQNFVRVASDVLQSFNTSQVVPRACKKVVQIAHKMTSLLATPQHASLGLKPLREAAIRLAPRPSCLTPIHADFLQLALLAKFYHKAAEFLDSSPIFEVDPPSTALGALDLLRFYYYGGMIFVGLKRYHDALDFFRTACTVPASALSTVMVESYKKLLLVSLLVPERGPTVGEGNDVSRLLPKYTSNVVARHIRHAVPAYHEIAAAAETQKAEALDAAIAKHLETLLKDNNLGLAKQVLRYVVSRNIQQLTHTYVTLSLADIAKHAKLSDAATAQRHIIDLVESGTIAAQVDEVSGMVYFQEDKIEDFGSTQSIERLDKEMQAVIELAARMKELDVRISTTPAYVSKMMGSRIGVMHGGGGGESSIGPDGMPDDMMTGEDFVASMGLAYMGQASSSSATS